MAIVKSKTEVAAYALAVAASAALLIAAYAHRTPFSSQEAWGFVTGGWCVWLQVKENIWAWPISLVNNAVFFFLFQRERLFGDMGLQAAYFTLGAYGWYTWLFGGQAHTHAKVVRSSARLLVILSVVTVAATTLLTIYLRSINDAAPLLDAFTTVLSLIAQGMLARKLIENWPAWIVVNIISIAMFVYKNLYLTALLSVVFTAMCILGYLRWSRQLHESSREETSVLV